MTAPRGVIINLWLPIGLTIVFTYGLIAWLGRRRPPLRESGVPAGVSRASTAPSTTSQPTTEPPVDETTEPPAPTYATPTKAPFKLTAKVLTKQCFGSAGRNLTYRILVAYSGPELDPSVAGRTTTSSGPTTGQQRPGTQTHWKPTTTEQERQQCSPGGNPARVESVRRAGRTDQAEIPTAEWRPIACEPHASPPLFCLPCR